MGRTRLPRLIAVVGLGVALGACGSPGASETGSPASVASAQPSTAADPFAGLTYRLGLPAGWVTLGSPGYDASLDQGSDMAQWLTHLELAGPNAFRAYESRPDAAGMRLAVNPPVGWNSDADGPLTDQELLATLPGVTGEVQGDLVGIGYAGKALRIRWTQELDWGSGSPSSRACVGYQVMTEFDPVNVVFTWPTGTDRLAEVEALMASFVVTGSPVSTIEPGVSPTPSPTPFDKFATPGPTTAIHAAPELEALLPDSVDGRSLAKSSRTGVDLGMTEVDPVLKAFGKQPADMAGASAVPDSPPLLVVGVTRLRGIAAADLLAVIIAQTPDATTSAVTIEGHRLTYVAAGAWPVWYLASGEYLYGIAAVDEATVGRVIELLNLPD